MKIVQIKLEEITEYHGNSRINDESVKELVKDIQQYGFNVPLIINLNNVVIAGHARLKALKELEWETAPCVLIDLPEYRQNEYRIIDNKVQELSQGDPDKLIVELRNFDDFDEIADMFGSQLAGLLGNDVGLNVKHDSQDKIEKVSGDMEGHFEGLTQRREEAIKYCRCSHCNEEFGYKE